MGMPIYEYICKKCDSEFEAIVQGSQEVVCPSCDSKRLEKKFSAFAVVNNGPELSPCAEAGCEKSCPAMAGGGCPMN